jgi:hypothetical protein
MEPNYEYRKNLPPIEQGNYTNSGYIKKLRLAISLSFKYGLIMPYGAGCVPKATGTR